MKTMASDIRWGVEQRLEFIEFHLYWEAGVNRSDITGHFGVSVPQASNDIRRYQEIAPKNIRYDLSAKRYFATDEFEPVFLKPDADQYLNHLHSISQGLHGSEETWISQFPEFETLPAPHRNVDPEVLQAILVGARNGNAVEIRYQSLSASRPKPIWRWISPHAFGFDGMRWHTRAYCHIDEKFKDFLLSRVLGVRKTAEARALGNDDRLWWETVSVAMKPHPKLTADQQAVVAQDYGMKKNRLHVEVKLALLYYFLRRHGLGLSAGESNPREQHIILANDDEVRSALERVQYGEGA